MHVLGLHELNTFLFHYSERKSDKKFVIFFSLQMLPSVLLTVRASTREEWRFSVRYMKQEKNLEHGVQFAMIDGT